MTRLLAALLLPLALAACEREARRFDAPARNQTASRRFPGTTVAGRSLPPLTMKLKSNHSLHNTTRSRRTI